MTRSRIPAAARRGARIAAVVAAGTLALSTAACAAAAAPPPVTAADPDSFQAQHYTTPLADVCPSTVAIQFNWWPQPDHGWAYQLIGDAGVVDDERYTYSGPLGSTGINLELRSGGPATGGQLPLAQLYSDDSILLGVTTTEDSIGNTEDFPTVSVFAYETTSPLVFFWGDPDWHFENLTDIKNSGETVLAFEGSPFLGVLEALDLLDPDQVDASYQGDPARFVVEEGKVLQQGFLTSEVYLYEHDVTEWGKPVQYVKIGDEYGAYHSQVSIRSDRFEENRACLEGLVPLLQQGGVDYASDPSATNEVLVDVAGRFSSSGASLSPGLAEWAAKTAVEEGIIGNGPDGVFGSFDLDRVSDFIRDATPALREAGFDVPDGLEPGDFLTNEFLDPEIGL